MAILENEVLIGINGKNVNYYEKLGYKIDRVKDKDGKYRVKLGTKILVKVKDLLNGSRVRVTRVCDDCCEVTPNRVLSSLLLIRWEDGKDRCRKCGNLHMRKLARENLPYERSLEFFAKENNKDNLLKEFSDKNSITPDKIFKASNDDFYWDCIKCGSEFIQSASTRTYQGCGCPFCAGKRVNHTNNLLVMKHEVAKEWHPIKNGELNPQDVYFKSNIYAWWKCKECHGEWKSRIETRSNRNYGCPNCAQSKGEKTIKKWLEENGISFLPQKEFEGLIGTGGGNLSYDFFLLKENILIEYQGQFHDGSNGDYTCINLESQIEHDKRKREFAQSNNIELFEIWYWDFNNIEEILENKIFEMGEFNVRES